ncbi:MAG: hypothetical protein K6F99_04080 [Lachnospiraceae bacterium]|nr:hypothetical protein [Lachnospiraceae bacterium]
MVVDKALLCIVDVDKVNDETPIKNIVDDANMLSSLLRGYGTAHHKMSTAKFLEDVKGTLTSALNPKTMDGARGDVGSFDPNWYKEAFATVSYFKAFEVQYNPSSIHFDTAAGKQENLRKQQGNSFEDMIYSQNFSGITNMSLQLVFDDTTVSDAFMLQNTQPNLSNTKSMVQSLVGGEHSVRQKVDALVGLLTDPLYRQVVFFWGDMNFRGELARVNARYSMFNTQGNPVRATVDLFISQDSDKKDYEYDELQWMKAFGKVFNEKTGIGGFGGSSVLNGNLLNIKL